MTSANLTREETAHRSAHITVDTIDVVLDLTSATDPAAPGFPVTTTLTFTSATSATWIDFLGNAVHGVTVNNQPQPVQWDEARIGVENLDTAPGAVNVVQVVAEGAYSRSGEGLHRYVDPADGATYLYTQYEPADSRRVMACFEQPDLKASYRFTVTAPAGWQVLNNTAPTEVTTHGDTQTVVFAPTGRISSYITCIAAGPYHRVDSVWESADQRVDLGVLCRASLAEHLDADEIITITRQGLDFFTTQFASPYPWGKYDQIFVPEYNLGAMENPGLVTFTESYVFRGAATAAQYEGRANTILHEMAHMWFGDLVTMRWWDDLWLKESFADYMGAHAAAAATRHTDAWVTFANRRKAWAYQQDQLPTTHPIVADITDLEAAKLNFDGITYAKGAAVLKQLVAYVGEDAFFAAARTYFGRHAYGNTTLQDLLSILNDVSGRDLNTWADAWLTTSGVTTITADSVTTTASALVVDAITGIAGAVPQANTPDTVVITQTPARPHQFSVGLFTWEAGALVCTHTQDITLTQETTTVAIPGWDDAPLRILNHGDWTYAKTRLDQQSLVTVTDHLSSISDPLTRALVWSSLWNSVRDAQLPARHYIDIVASHASNEPNSALLGAALANTAYALDHYVHPDARQQTRAAWGDTVWQGLHNAAPASDAQLAWARALAPAIANVPHSTHAPAVLSLLNGTTDTPTGLPLDADLRWAWLTALATIGHVNEETLTAEAQRDNTGSGRTAHLRALASQPDAAVRESAWQAAWEDTTLSNDHVDAKIAGFTAGDRPDLTHTVEPEYFDRILPVWNTRSIEIARRLVTGLFPTNTEGDRAGDWLTAHPEAPAALRRLVMEQRDHAHRATQAQTCDGETATTRH
ncbi:aminopeptidase N [Jonesia quinghaiensis]|uniref:aminopeptidase N n=1 Tax=Jonesia quinghaiensis TaxID=262806 RepID=UPI00040BFCA8|nr:aminopeptidase N [Jonesia quinghaiensis]